MRRLLNREGTISPFRKAQELGMGPDPDRNAGRMTGLVALGSGCHRAANPTRLAALTAGYSSARGRALARLGLHNFQQVMTRALQLTF